MSEVITLRGAVLSKYKTIGAFSESIGWSRNKASRILNGIQEPDTKDMCDITDCLGINKSETFMQIFFATLSTKWTKDRDTA